MVDSSHNNVIMVSYTYFFGGVMPVTLSIKNVPDEYAKKLRERATRHHRSVQGELMSIVEDALQTSERLTPEAVLQSIRNMGLSSGRESTGIVRIDRNIH